MISASQFKGLQDSSTPAGKALGQFRNQMSNALKIMGAGSLTQTNSMTSLPGMGNIPNMPKMPKMPSLKGLPTTLGNNG